MQIQISSIRIIVEFYSIVNKRYRRHVQTCPHLTPQRFKKKKRNTYSLWFTNSTSENATVKKNIITFTLIYFKLLNYNQ